MNILLIEPSFKRSEKAYPLGLGQLFAVLKSAGHKVFGVDLSFNGTEEVKKIISDNGIGMINVSAASYGISLICYSLKSVLPLCREIKRSFPSLPIIVNGPFAEVFKDELLKEYRDCFDQVISGQGTPDNTIFADRELFPLERYQGMFTKRKRYTQIITSIGCNRRCSYCPEPALNHCWQGRPVKNVIEELKLIADKYRMEEFHIEDANFFGGGTKRVKEFCRELAGSGLKMSWQCPNGIPPQDIDDLAVFSDMAKAGCYSICLSVETFDRGLQKSMGKECESSMLKRIVDAARKEGIEVTGYFMIGLPGQGLLSIKEDIRLSRSIGFDFINYTIFYPYPGSLWYSQYAKGMNIGEIFKNDGYTPELGIDVLKRQRAKAYLLNSFRLRTLKFAAKSFLQVKLPLRFLRRVTSCIFDLDLKY